MKLADVLGALKRRWYVAAISVLLAAGVAHIAWSNVPPEYERSASQLLLPGEATLPEGSNPYLFIGGLSQAGDILVRAVGEDDVAEAVADYPETQVAVVRDAAAGSVILTTVTAQSDEGARSVLDAMLEINAATLDRLQNEQEIPRDERITMMPLTQATSSSVVQKTRIVLTLVAGAVVVVVGIVLAVLIDGALRSRLRSRRFFALVTEDQTDDEGSATAISGPDDEVATERADVSQGRIDLDRPTDEEPGVLNGQMLDPDPPPAADRPRHPRHSARARRASLAGGRAAAAIEDEPTRP